MTSTSPGNPAGLLPTFVEWRAMVEEDELTADQERAVTEIIADSPAASATDLAIKLAFVFYLACDERGILYEDHPVSRTLKSIETSLPTLPADLRGLGEFALEQAQCAARRNFENYDRRMKLDATLGGISDITEDEAKIIKLLRSVSEKQRDYQLLVLNADDLEQKLLSMGTLAETIGGIWSGLVGQVQGLQRTYCDLTGRSFPLPN